MEYKTLETKSGTVIIKDAEESELKNLVDIYKSVFTKHNIFQRSSQEIIQYLKESNKNNAEFGGGYVIAKIGNKIVGGMLIKKEGEDLEGKHIIWKYNHVGISSDLAGQGIGTALIEAADSKIKGLIKQNKIKTAKVELGVSENEEAALEFYKKCGFEIEGKLKSHYRFDELVYILGKEIIE